MLCVFPANGLARVKKVTLSTLAALPTGAHPAIPARSPHLASAMSQPQQLHEHSEARPPRAGHAAPAISSASRAHLAPELTRPRRV